MRRNPEVQRKVFASHLVITDDSRVADVAVPTFQMIIVNVVNLENVIHVIRVEPLDIAISASKNYVASILVVAVEVRLQLDPRFMARQHGPAVTPHFASFVVQLENSNIC